MISSKEFGSQWLTGSLLGLLFFCVLTLRAVSFWSAALFLGGSFLLAAVEGFRRKRRVAGLVGLFGVLPLIGLLQLVFHISVYRQATVIGVLAALSYLCVVFVASGVPARSVDGVRHALLWYAFVVAVVAMLLKLSSSLEMFGLFPVVAANAFTMGPFLYHNHWAVFVEIALPLAIYYVLRAQGGRTWLYASMAAALYGSVVVSASRSGVILCTLEIVVVPALVGRGRWAVVPSAGLVVLAVLIAGPEAVWSRFQTRDEVRSEFNQTSLSMLTARPLQGIGLGNWPIVYPQFAHFDMGRVANQAHCDWLQWAVEGGTFYLLLWLAIAGLAFRQAWRFPWAVGVPAVFGQALVDYPFSRPAVAGWVLVVLGLTLAGEGKYSRDDARAQRRPQLIH